MKISVIGGTGLIGRQVVEILAASGHQALAASPSRGVNTVTGEGLEKALTGASVVVDVSNSPSFEDGPVMEFFRTSTTNILNAARKAGVKHVVALSIVGLERVVGSGYIDAKVAQEELIKTSRIPYSLLRATQFFEFLDTIAGASTVGDEVRLSTRQFQPVAAADVAAEIARLARNGPLDSTIDLAGPERAPMANLVAAYLELRGDARRVIADPEATYFGARLQELSLVPTGPSLLGRISLRRWSRPLAGV